MNLNIYDFLMGVTISIVLLFFVLFYHINLYKNHSFLKIWVAGTGMVILGFVLSLFASVPSFRPYAIMSSNLLLILGQGVYYISLKSFFEDKLKFSNYRSALFSFLLIYVSVFSDNTTLRIFSTSIVLLMFSAFMLRLLYSHRTAEIHRSISFLIITYWINISFWIFRVLFTIMVLPSKPELYEFIVLLTDLSALLPSVLGSFGIILLTNQKLSSMLEKEKIKFSNIIDISPDLVVVTKLYDGKIFHANKKFIDKLGYRFEDIQNKSTLDLNIWNDNSARNLFLNALVECETLENYEAYLYTKEREPFLGSISSSKIVIDDEQYVISIIRDVSDLRETEKKLIESEQKYKVIALSSASWEAWFNENGKLIWTNEMIKHIIGYSPNEATKLEDIFKDIVISDNLASLAKEYKYALSSRISGKNEFLINHKIFGERWILISWKKIYDSNNVFSGYRTSTIDITDQKKAELKASELANKLKIEKEIAEKNSLIDSMTGLANRRYLEQRIMYEYARMKRNWSNLSIIMIDVDFFKLYNDTYGHVQGDICLKTIADTLRSTVKRQTDLVARYGGEEFVVLLPETDKCSASILADNIKTNIENLEIEHMTSTISDYVTVSIGIATFTKDCNVSCEDLIKKADFALYEAKSYGRNCVSHI